MQTVDAQTNFIEGIFVQELKNRFLCEVLIDGASTVCYVPSSCHLSNFLVLKGKKVLLVPTQASNARTKYALFAVRYRRSYILLNTSMANRAVEYSIHSRRFAFLQKRAFVLKEHRINNYKADLYIRDSSTVIEIKSIISTDVRASFPTVFSERTQKQLTQLQQMLTNGQKVCFFIVSLCPYVQEVVIDKETAFYEDFVKCVHLGMKAAAYTCRLKNFEISIDKEIPILWEVNE